MHVSNLRRPLLYYHITLLFARKNRKRIIDILGPSEFIVSSKISTENLFSKELTVILNNCKIIRKYIRKLNGVPRFFIIR